MAYTGKPEFHFKSLSETGINKTAIDALIFVEGGAIYTKVSQGSLDATSTIQDAINAGNVTEFSGGGASTIVTKINSNTTLSSDIDQLVVLDTSGAPLSSGDTKFTVTLPESPTDKTIIRIMDGEANAQDVPVLVSHTSGASTFKINGIEDDLTVDMNNIDFKLVFDAPNNNWALGGQ
jgi:hypothetical protein